MDSVIEPSIEFAWKLNSGRWNPLATIAVVPFVMLIRTILIPNLDCFDGERNPLNIYIYYIILWKWEMRKSVTVKQLDEVELLPTTFASLSAKNQL